MKTRLLSAKDFGSMAQKAQNLTQYQIAGMTDTERYFISDLENGKATAQLEKSIKVIRALGVAITASAK